MLYPGAGSLGILIALANRSKQFPIAISKVSPKIRYRLALYAMTWVFPPLTYNTTGFSAPVISLPISISTLANPSRRHTSNTVIHSNEGFLPHHRHRPSNQSTNIQRRSHARTKLTPKIQGRTPWYNRYSRYQRRLFLPLLGPGQRVL
jgi:hypothetical protein